jgi:hypothetical protein
MFAQFQSTKRTLHWAKVRLRYERDYVIRFVGNLMAEISL